MDLPNLIFEQSIVNVMDIKINILVGTANSMDAGQTTMYLC